MPVRICNRILFASISLWLSVAHPAHAQVSRIITYQELFEKSDFIVIAAPVTKTADTLERTYYPDLAQVNANGRQAPVPAIGVETTLEVLAVLKGKSDIKRFVLHHYRSVPSSELSFGGASTVSFDPNDPKQPREFLLFLVREKDGRYAPYGGQTFPDGESIMSVNGDHGR
jgi:hypothetical protein